MLTKHWIVRSILLLSVMLSLSSLRAQDKTVINLYSSGDTNITDWYQNVVIPDFEAKYPQYTVQFTNSRATGDEPIVDRAIAALQTNSDPQVDVMDFDPRDYQAAIDADLWYKPTVADIPNLANVTSAATITDMGASYRGSQVLVAYNSAVVPEAEVPHTFAELVTWVKAHPGQFVYCRPDKGGSGGSMVVRALYEVSGQDPTLFRSSYFNQALVDAFYPKAFDLLNEIDPYIYEDGSYPAGNNPVLELLSNGSVSMVTAWSDQAIQALNLGLLPDTTKLVQFTDLPFPGGYTTLAIPKNSANLKGAQDFVNYLLSAEGQTSVVKNIGGFPAISWDMLPTELQTQFNSVITDRVPVWPGGAYSGPLTQGWYEKVATNIDPKS